MGSTRRAFSIFPLGLLWLTLSGCMTLMEKGSVLLDGSAFREKETARWGDRKNSAGQAKGFVLREVRERDGRELIAITQEDFPFLRINATPPGKDGVFHLLSLEYLSSHEAGWNEFTLDLSGAGSWSVRGLRRLLRVESLEPVQISGGKIRYKEERLTGPEALTALRNRYERISVLAEWMRQQEEPRRPLSFKDFDARWKGELLPELLPEKKRPSRWQTAVAGAEEGDWVSANGVRWNAAYTRALLPEDLWPLRDTGALLRDWEEALSWIWLFYHWDYLAGLLDEGAALENISK